MSEPYQIFSFIVDGVEAERAIVETHRILIAHGGALESDSMLYLSDLEGREFEPQPAMDGDEALQRLMTHASLGSIDYAMPEAMTNISFEGRGKVELIAISILPRAFEAGGDATRQRYEKIARQLHDRLSATRTISDWGLFCRGVRRDEELARLREGRFEGEFALLDLRTSES